MAREETQPSRVVLRAVCGTQVLESDQAECGAGATSVGDSDLAVLVLEVSWALADAAHDLPAGRVSARGRAELADTLQALGFVLRVGAAPERDAGREAGG